MYLINTVSGEGIKFDYDEFTDQSPREWDDFTENDPAKSP